MEFRILGGLEAFNGQRSLPLGSPQQRALAATLLLNANRGVPVAELVEELWPERTPSSATHAVEVYVSRLRKVLHADGEERLATEGRAYVLRTRPDELDADRFERLFDEGRTALAEDRPERAAEFLREALSLWRGEALEGLQCGPATRAAAGRLDHLRLDAIEARIEAELACGTHSGLVAELEALVAAEPLRERFHGQLMLALYRGGRQAEALEAYRAARSMLLDELGLEPSPSLQRLERAILTHDASLDLAPRAAARRPPLPAPLTRLVGRDAELDELEELLRSDDVRLVTITGTGGIGKTRLALEVARRLEQHYADGVAFLELAPVRRPPLVVHAVAEALGVHEQPGASLLETIAGSLADRQMLLVLDNFEHVLDAAPVVSQLLAATQRVQIVATSRARLRLYGEHEYDVSPLQCPPIGEQSVGALLGYAAVELFVDCTRRRVPGFALGRANAASVAEICTWLDGVPLAIELAAARSRALDPPTLLAHLASRLPVLVAGPRDAPERQRSLRATIDWSYELLRPEERMLFSRLAVFNGGFTTDTCAAVCGGDAATLESLAEKNLVARDPGERDRFSLLETIREYGLERLRESGSLATVAQLHAEHFVGLAERAEPELRGPAQLEWFARLDAEQANVWSAFAWALDHERYDLPLRIGASLWRYWEARGAITEARRRLDDTISRSSGDTIAARPAALFASGRMALRHGDLDHARSVFTEALSLFEAARAHGGVALCTAGLGWIAHVVGPVEDAVTLSSDAVELARSSGQDWIVGDALNNLGVALRAVGDLDGSRAALEESLAIRRRIGELEGITAALNGLALIAIAEDDFDAAEELFGEAFSVSEQRGDLFYAAAKDVVLAYLAFGRGDLGRTTALCVRALESCREHGYQQFTAYALETLAGVAAAEGRPRQAARVLGAAVSVAQRLGRGVGRADGVTYDWEARAVKRVLDDARLAFGLDAWNSALDEGHRLGVAEVLASTEEWTPSAVEPRVREDGAPLAPPARRA